MNAYALFLYGNIYEGYNYFLCTSVEMVPTVSGGRPAGTLLLKSIMYECVCAILIWQYI